MSEPFFTRLSQAIPPENHLVKILLFGEETAEGFHLGGAWFLAPISGTSVPSPIDAPLAWSHLETERPRPLICHQEMAAGCKEGLNLLDQLEPALRTLGEKRALTTLRGHLMALQDHHIAEHKSGALSNQIRTALVG